MSELTAAGRRIKITFFVDNGFPELKGVETLTIRSRVLFMLLPPNVTAKETA